jgi:hypothetical protein
MMHFGIRVKKNYSHRYLSATYIVDLACADSSPKMKKLKYDCFVALLYIGNVNAGCNDFYFSKTSAYHRCMLLFLCVSNVT